TFRGCAPSCHGGRCLLSSRDAIPSGGYSPSSRRRLRWSSPLMLTDTIRPRVSRETRRLLAAVGLALLALWILARLRFPERPASPNPVVPVLTQISPPTTFAGLAQETARVEQRIA